MTEPTYQCGCCGKPMNLADAGFYKLSDPPGPICKPCCEKTDYQNEVPRRVWKMKDVQADRDAECT